MKAYKLFICIPVFFSGKILATPEFELATAPRAISFPQDHGSHPGFKNEWWYLTFNVQDDQQNDYAGQFTLFRSGLQPKPTVSNTWNIHQVYMAHAALTLPNFEQYLYQEKFSRDSYGLAGVRVNPFRVWLHDWSLKSQFEMAFSPLLLEYTLKDCNVQLQLEAIKPIVLQGDKGLSQKSSKKGNASYYYSIPRLKVTGKINYQNKEINVKGEGWFDREWGTTLLGDGQIGWDWYALRFNTQEELMLYFMQRTDQKPDVHNYAVWINSSGEKEILSSQDVQITKLKQWQAPNQNTYTTQWQIRIPEKNLDITLDAILANQFMQASIPYWEGGVNVTGTHVGNGFVEQFYEGGVLGALLGASQN